MCSGDLTGSFEQVDRGYELAIDEQPLVYPSAAPTCAGGIEPLTLTLSLTNPVPSGVFATVNGQDLPNLSPSAEPSLSIGAIACGHVTGVSGDASSPPDHESSVWILDRTGMLRDCFASNSLPDGRTVEVTNTEPSNHTINLSWSGNSCDTSATLNFETTEAGYSWLARRKQGLPAARALPSASAF